MYCARNKIAMDISKLDLNILKTLLVLLQEKNTNKAAERLNTSQPAVSRTLAKIREEFDDPLFIRQSRGLKLSPKAEELAISLPKIFSDLQHTLQGDSFSPEQLTGQMKIAMNGFIIETHGYQICEAINKDAPNLNIELHNFSPKTAAELINGEFDFAINYYPLDISKELRQVPIGLLTFIGICRVDHPLAHQHIPLQDIYNYDLVGLIVPEFNLHTMLAQTFSTQEVTKHPNFRSQTVNPLLNYIEHRDSIFIAPKSLLETLNNHKFSYVTIDDEQKRNQIKVGLFYNSKHMNSAKFKWIEKIVDNILPPKMT